MLHPPAAGVLISSGAGRASLPPVRRAQGPRSLQIRTDLRISGIHAQRLRELRQRLRELTALRQDDPQVAVSLSVVRVETNGFAQLDERIVQPAHLAQARSQIRPE